MLEGAAHQLLIVQVLNIIVQVVLEPAIRGKYGGAANVRLMRELRSSCSLR